jgi:hypothetical protein
MAKKYNWDAERAKRGLPPNLPLAARCQPESPAHTRDGDEAFACGECGAIYYSLVLRDKELGVLCAGCGSFREIRRTLTEAGY